jgi:hypothetical protein
MNRPLEINIEYIRKGSLQMNKAKSCRPSYPSLAIAQSHARNGSRFPMHRILFGLSISYQILKAYSSRRIPPDEAVAVKGAIQCAESMLEQ